MIHFLKIDLWSRYAIESINLFWFSNLLHFYIIVRSRSCRVG
ncbi:hypothetical protein [Moorena sp. SIO3B2]|nr:hypothetical protein [Moorena sp. SIO3B2]